MNSFKQVRLIAFFLPQFHPVPENNEWWGPGFTEWQNVISARPLFPGHYQPHLPADLGFYDLRVPEVREAQAGLAQRHGIEGFCYWHYWFEGRRILERPFNEVLTSGRPRFSFCLAWANESWSRRWLGEHRDVLIEQTYSARDDANHARWLAGVFSDRRSVRVDGRPLFVMYRPEDHPNLRRFVTLLQRECERAGAGRPFVLGTTSHRDGDCRDLGLDGTIAWEPRLGMVVPSGAQVYDEELKIVRDADARRLMHAAKASYPSFPCVVVGWDNTPRRGTAGVVFTEQSPRLFETALADACAQVISSPPDERLVFLNAWNEWAEGNHLEPDQRHGLDFLSAVRRVAAVAPFRVEEARAEKVGLSQ
jgi:hypothetical protein